MARKQIQHEERHWHLDRRVPLALIFTIFVQTATAFWWASGISASVANAQVQINELRTNPDRITRLEGKLESLNETLKRLEVSIDRLAPRPRAPR